MRPTFFSDRRFSLRAQLRLLVLEDRLAPATLLHSLFPPGSPQQGAAFGYSVAANTNFHVVGAPYARVGNSSSFGQAFVYSASTGALIATLNNPTPSGDDFFGYCVAVSGNTVVVGAYGDNTGAPDAGSAYVFDAGTGALVATLNNPTPLNGDYFGSTVAVSGNIVVVGASNDDTGATDGGSAYVFNATTGALVFTLNNPTPAIQDGFGNAVAVSGNTVVVGAYADDTGASNAGSAYAFNAITGAPVFTLNNPTPALNDKFGNAVAVSGNVVVVGTSADDTGAADAGSAYLFDATTGGLVFALNNPAPALNDRFGFSVAASGSTVVVGAVSDDTGATNAGSVYVYNASTGLPVATLNNPDPASFLGFGFSVAVSGNTVVSRAGEVAYVIDANTGALVATLNNPTLAYHEDRFGSSVAVSGNIVVVGAFLTLDIGAAYVINAGTGALVATLNNPTPAYGDWFGYSVAVSGNTAVVGAYSDDTGAPDAGSAYVFNATTGALVATLNNPTPADGDNFGATVAVSGNVVVVGAPHDDTGESNAGSAYVFNASTGALVATLNNPNLDIDAEFGNSVAVSGNAVIVGEYQFLQGYAYVFDTTTGALITTLNNPTPQSGDQFGSSVAVSGNTVVVGANSDNTGASNAGSAYLFNASTFALIATLNNPTPAIDDNFGGSVAVSGNTVVVGAHVDNTGATAAGSAYLFNASTGALVDTLNNPTPENYDVFGNAVAVSGSTVIVGAAQDNTLNAVQGASYIYALATPTVQAVQINDGAAQRSRVVNLTVSFGAQVTFAGEVGDAFTLTRTGGGAISFTASSQIVGGATVVTLNGFTGAETQSGSLRDGRYTLTTLASQISANGQQMAANYTFGDAQGLFRYYGDMNGDRRVDISDFGFFSLAYLTQANYNSALDFNNDGRIDIADFGQFSARFFTTLP